ncbi:MAG: S8 family serine peptidase [Thermoanaerobaculales bacterium]
MRSTAACLCFALVFGALFCVGGAAEASKFTPLEWQQPVQQHSFSAFVDQSKHTTWIRDRDRTFVDDEIERRFGPGELVDVIVDLNRCVPPGAIQKLLAPFGKVRYIGQRITFVLLDNVRYEDLPKLASIPEVAMVEWQPPLVWTNDVSSRSVQSRASLTFSPNTAGDAGFDGNGIRIAIIDSGVDDGHETFSGKFAGGFDASLYEDTNGNGIDDSCEPAPVGNGVCTDADDEPATGTTNPDDVFGHGTHVAGIALGAGATGRTCSTPDDGSTTNCAGVASGADLIDVKIDNTGSLANAMEAIDWVGRMAATLNIRVANMSFAFCVDDDGTSAIAQQTSALAAVGVVPVVAHGNAGNCGVAAGTQLTSAPGSASFAVTVGGTDDRDTVARNDDTNYSGFMQGPRMDFSAATPNLLALKPDLTAPGQNIFSAQEGTTTSYVSFSGTSMAAPQVTGAAAVVLQARPTMTPDSLKDLLKQNADTTLNTAQFPAVDPNWDDDLGSGMLNLWAAINAAAAADILFPSCVGAPASPGQPCALAAPNPPWNNSTDITVAAPPQVGVANTLSARVRNTSPAAVNVLVNFGVYVFAAGNTQFFHIGSQPVTVPGSTTITVNQPWTPAATNHQCAQVSIAYGLDTNFDNNVTQRNLQIAPSTYTMRVENPFAVPAKMRLDARSTRDGWRCEVEEEEFILDPYQDCPRDVEVKFVAPEDARPGQRGTCDIAVYALPEGQEEPRLVGGVTVETYVPKTCRAWIEVVDRTGRPIADARVRVGREKGETDEQGVVALTVLPYVRTKVEAEGRGGGGVAKVRPLCGAGRLRLILDRKGLEAVTDNLRWSDLGVEPRK